MGSFAVALSLLFFPFVIPGMLLSWVVRERSGPWILPLAALLIALTWRLIVGSWIISIGGDLPGEWPVEGMRVIVNWAFGTLFVQAGFRMPRDFKQGLQARPGCRVESGTTP